MIQNTQISLTPEKRQRPDKIIKTQITSTSPFTINTEKKQNIKQISFNGNEGIIEIEITNKKQQIYLWNSTNNKKTNEKSYSSLKLQNIESYIRSHENINRKELIRILQLQDDYLAHNPSYSKLILKQLNQKVRKQAQENQYLMNQNRKNKTIIEEYKTIKIQNINSYIEQNNFLRSKINLYEQQINKLNMSKLNDLKIFTQQSEKMKLNQEKFLVEWKQQFNNKFLQLNLVTQDKYRELTDHIINLQNRLNAAEKIIRQIQIARSFSFNSNVKQSQKHNELFQKIQGDNDSIIPDDISLKIVKVDQSFKIKEVHQNKIKELQQKIMLILSRNKILEDQKKQINNQLVELHEKLRNYEFLNEKISKQMNIKTQRLFLFQNDKKIQSSKNKNYIQSIEIIRNLLNKSQQRTSQAQSQLQLLVKQNNLMLIKLQQSLGYKQTNLKLERQNTNLKKTKIELQYLVYQYNKLNQQLKKNVNELSYQLQDLKLKKIQDEIRMVEVQTNIQHSNIFTQQKFITQTLQSSIIKLAHLQQQFNHYQTLN